MKTEMFGYVPGGYARILDAFTRLLAEEGVVIEPGQPSRLAGGLAVETRSGASAFDRIDLSCAAGRQDLPGPERRGTAENRGSRVQRSDLRVGAAAANHSADTT